MALSTGSFAFETELTLFSEVVLGTIRALNDFPPPPSSSGPHVLLMGEGRMLSASLLSGEGKRFPIKSNKSTHWLKDARRDKQGTSVARHGGTRFVAEDAEFRSSTKTYTHTHVHGWVELVGF